MTITDSSTDLVIAAPEGGILTFDDTHRRLIADQIAPGASPAEIETFLYVCAHVQLDPMRNQIWLVPRYDSQLRRKVFKPQTGIDGLRLIAERTRLYGGSLAPQWCGPDGVWLDIWANPDRPPTAARFQVTRKDWDQPAVGIATWEEFAVTVPQYEKRNGKNVKVGTKLAPMWEQMGPHMLAKCAEAQALRRAFPAEMSGLYTDDEIAAALEQEREQVTVIDASSVATANDGISEDERRRVQEIFAELMPRFHQVGDVNEFKKRLRAEADERGIGPIDRVTGNALTLAQAELMRDLHAEVAGGDTEVIEGELVGPGEPWTDSPEGDTTVAVSIYAAHVGVKDDTHTPVERLQAIADHHACTPEEALDRVREWAGL
ncbi:MAG: phage recombination protein Bet [Actinomycetota bacterium]